MDEFSCKISRRPYILLETKQVQTCSFANMINSFERMEKQGRGSRRMLLFKIFTFLSNYPNVNFWDIFILNKNRTVEKNFIEFDQTFHESGIINEKEEARRRRKRIPGIFATRKKEEKESWNVSQFFSLYPKAFLLPTFSTFLNSIELYSPRP